MNRIVFKCVFVAIIFISGYALAVLFYSIKNHRMLLGAKEQEHLYDYYWDNNNWNNVFSTEL